eukprot:scaffold56400_cov52-Phaeocystis_antarctica.AAC.1
MPLHELQQGRILLGRPRPLDDALSLALWWEEAEEGRILEATRRGPEGRTVSAHAAKAAAHAAYADRELLLRDRTGVRVAAGLRTVDGHCLLDAHGRLHRHPHLQTPLQPGLYLLLQPCLLQDLCLQQRRVHRLQGGQPQPRRLLLVQPRLVQRDLHRLRCAEVDCTVQRRQAEGVEVGHAGDAGRANGDARRADGAGRVELHLTTHLRGEANLVDVGQHGPHGTRAARTPC